MKTGQDRWSWMLGWEPAFAFVCDDTQLLAARAVPEESLEDI